jgi:uncharacterized membrane protein
VSGKSSRQSRTGSGRPAVQGQTVRDQKRAQFEGPRRRTSLHLILAGVALLALAAIAAVILVGRGAGADATTVTAAAPGGDVTIPLAKVADGQAHFFTYDAGGTQVKYFVMKSADGKVRVAFDACDVCYAQKKGYHQEGDVMVCNNCGRRFPSNQINVQQGGCNPSPLTRTTRGQNLVLKASDLQTGVQYFQ